MKTCPSWKRQSQDSARMEFSREGGRCWPIFEKPVLTKQVLLLLLYYCRQHTVAALALQARLRPIAFQAFSVCLELSAWSSIFCSLYYYETQTSHCGCGRDLVATSVTPISSGLIQLLWLAKKVSHFPLTFPCEPLSNCMCKRITTPDRGGQSRIVP